MLTVTTMSNWNFKDASNQYNAVKCSLSQLCQAETSKKLTINIIQLNAHCHNYVKLELQRR